MGVARDTKSLRKQRGLIANMLAAFVGQALYGDAVYYRLLLREDDDMNQIRKL